MIYPRPPLILEGGEKKMFRECDDRHYESPKVTECVALRTTSEACLPEKKDLVRSLDLTFGLLKIEG